MPALRRDQAALTRPAARHVYVHVPFCARRCSYCDFSIAVRRVVPVDEYIEALGRELAARVGEYRQTVDTIYFGGGTPSSLGGHGLRRALELVTKRFNSVADAEVTIEANPDDVSAEAVRIWRDAGVTRVSLGAQTFNEDALKWMHRSHDANAVERAVYILRDEGIRNLSLDLIFALPNALNRNLEMDIDRLLLLQPSHISLYGLTAEARTALGKWVANGTATELGEEGYEADYLLAHERLTAFGMDHYEVSNYGKPGFRARHNSAYWTGVPYLGFGPSAHGFDGAVRRWNIRHYVDWKNAVSMAEDPLDDSELLTAENRIAEAVYLGLRTSDGLWVDSRDEPLLSKWEQAGWIERTNMSRVRCTPLGWLRLDGLAAALTHHRSR